MNAPEAACQQPHRICLAVAEPSIAKPICFPVAVRDVHDGAPPEVARLVTRARLRVHRPVRG
jgi:hypothetical protein